MEKFSLDAMAESGQASCGRCPAGDTRNRIQRPSARCAGLCSPDRGYPLDEHENPGKATVQVLRGRCPDDRRGRDVGRPLGDLLVVPDRHTLEALEDSAVLLTVSKAARCNSGAALSGHWVLPCNVAAWAMTPAGSWLPRSGGQEVGPARTACAPAFAGFPRRLPAARQPARTPSCGAGSS